MTPKPRARTTRAGGFRLGAALIGLVALVVLAYAAYKFLSNRAGEAAIQYIPADAMMVGTFDGTPSERQVLAFAKINQALNDEGIPDLMASQISKGLANNPLAKDLKPFISKNAAFAMWAKKGFAESDTAVYFAISDPDKVQDALKKDCPNSPEPGLYATQAGSEFFGVIGNYLVMVSSEPRFNQIVKVSKGLLPSVATLNEYKSARAALPSDSNLMLFVTPEVYALSGQKAISDAWGSVGIAVRDDGLAVACRYPQAKLDLSSIPAFHQAALKNLPAGAYGVLGYSDASSWFDRITKEAVSKADLDKGLQQMKDQTGLVLDDVLPGLKGDFELAVYPSTGSSKTPEFLAYLDSQNGGSPIDLAQKIRASIAAHEANWGNVTVSESKQGDATIWRITQPKQPNAQPGQTALAIPGSASTTTVGPNGINNTTTIGSPNGVQVQSSLSSGPGTPNPDTGGKPISGPHVDVPPAGASVPPAGANLPPAGANVPPPGMNVPANAQPNNQIPDHADLILLKDTVYISTADDLTQKVTALAQGGATLADDGPFVNMQRMLGHNAQAVLMVSVYRILATVNSGPGAQADLNTVFGGANTGVAGSSSFDKTTGVGDLFIPLDWTKAIHWLGKTMKDMDGAQNGAPKRA